MVVSEAPTSESDSNLVISSAADDVNNAVTCIFVRHLEALHMQLAAFLCLYLSAPYSRFKRSTNTRRTAKQQ